MPVAITASPMINNFCDSVASNGNSVVFFPLAFCAIPVINNLTDFMLWKLHIHPFLCVSRRTPALSAVAFP